MKRPLPILYRGGGWKQMNAISLVDLESPSVVVGLVMRTWSWELVLENLYNVYKRSMAVAYFDNDRVLYKWRMEHLAL